jgi:hypothetical protein
VLMMEKQSSATRKPVQMMSSVITAAEPMTQLNTRSGAD